MSSSRAIAIISLIFSLVAIIAGFIGISMSHYLTEPYLVQTDPEVGFFIEPYDRVLHLRDFETDNRIDLEVCFYNKGKIPVYHARMFSDTRSLEPHEFHAMNLINLHGLVFGDVPVCDSLHLSHPNISTVLNEVQTIPFVLYCFNCEPVNRNITVDVCLYDRNNSFCNDWVETTYWE